MKTNSAQLEILIMSGTSFSSSLYSESKSAGNKKHLSEKESLEEACWNGLMNRMFPEIFMQARDIKLMYIWKIRQTFSFFDFKIFECPTKTDKVFSIDPYSFLEMQSRN